MPSTMTDFIEKSKEHKLTDIIDSKNLPLTVKISQNFTLRDETVLLENQVLTILERKRVHLLCGKNWKKETFRLQILNAEKNLVDIVEEYYPNTLDEICKIKNEVKYVYLKNQFQYGKYNLKMYTRCKIREINYKEENINMVDEINGNSIQLPISILFDGCTFVFIHRIETLAIEEFVNKELQRPVSIHAHYLHDKTFPEGVVRIAGLHIYDAIVTVTEINSKLKYDLFPLHRNIKAFQLQMLHLPEELSGVRNFTCDQYRQHLKEITFSMHFNIFKVHFYGSLELEGQLICRNVTSNQNHQSISKPNESSYKTLEVSKICPSEENMQDEISYGFNDIRKPEKVGNKVFKKIVPSTNEESTETPQSTATSTATSHMPDYNLKDTQKSIVADFSVVFPRICERQKRVLNLFNIKKHQKQEQVNPLYGSVDTLQRNYEMEYYQNKPLPKVTRNSAPPRLELSKEPSYLGKSQNEGDDLSNSYKGPSSNFQTSNSFPVTKPVNEHLRLFELLNGNNPMVKNPLYGSVDTLQGSDKMEIYRITPLPEDTRKSAPAILELSKQASFLDTSKNETDRLLNSHVSPITNFHTSTSVQVTNPRNEYFRRIELQSVNNNRSKSKNESRTISPTSSPSVLRDISSTVCSPLSEKLRKREEEREVQESVYKSDHRTDLKSRRVHKDSTQLDTVPKTEAKSFPLWRPDKYKVSPRKSTYEIYNHNHFYESIIYAQMNKVRRPSLNIYDPLKERELKSLSEVKMLKLSDVIKLLQKLNLSRHKNIFKDHIVTGTLLIDSNEETFTEMGTTKFEARKLYKYIRGWRPKERSSFSDKNGYLEHFSVHDIFILLQNINLPILATFCKENLVDGFFLRDLVESGYIPKVLKEEYKISLMDIEFRRLKLVV